MTGPIICGVDDSESARGAVRVARELSARLRLRLVFVGILDDASSDEKIASVAARLHQLAEATEADRGAHWLVDVGHPADRLIAAAEDETAALIVVGSTGPRSSLLGSISAEVSRRAPCPVVVVAPGADRVLADDRRASSTDSRLADDRYAGVTGSIRVGPTAARRDTRRDPRRATKPAASPASATSNA